MSVDRLMYEVPAAAEQLSVSARTLERLIRDGEVASVKVGRRRLVPRDALVSYIERLRESA